MEALGKGDTAEASAIRNSIQVNKDIAAGVSLTSEDLKTAQSWAFDEYFKGSTQSMEELQQMAEENILEQKRSRDASATDAQALFGDSSCPCDRL